MALCKGLRVGWFGGFLIGACLFSAHAWGTEPVEVDREPDGAAGTEAARTADSGGREDPPSEWVAEIMENQEMLESLDLLDKLELFIGGSRFSPHHFE